MALGSHVDCRFALSCRGEIHDFVLGADRALRFTHLVAQLWLQCRERNLLHQIDAFYSYYCLYSCMEIHQLRALESIAREGSFLAAAKRLDRQTLLLHRKTPHSYQIKQAGRGRRTYAESP